MNDFLKDLSNEIDNDIDADVDLVALCCKPYHAMVMLLCAVIFGSIGCVIAIAALAATFSVAKSMVGNTV